MAHQNLSGGVILSSMAKENVFTLWYGLVYELITINVSAGCTSFVKRPERISLILGKRLT